MQITIVVLGADELAARFGQAASGLRRGGSVRIGNSAQVPYAQAVHDGARPHVIYARAGSALFWRGAAHPVRKVNHPGNKANPYLTDALQATIPAIGTTLSKAVVAMIETGSGDLGQAVLAAGYLVEAEAKRRAPMGRTGNLRRDIHTAPYGR